MAISSSISLADYKAPWRCLCRAFLQSRDHWKQQAKGYREEIQQLKQELHNARLSAQTECRDDSRRNSQAHKAQANRDHVLPHWATMPGHQFSAELISLCCQLSQLIGFRAVPKVLRCIRDAFGIALKIPSRDAVRNWSCRNGVAILQQSQKADDWIWMIDHSVQLGKMFVLVVLGIRQSQLPVGRPLKREDMTPLAVMPTKARDKVEVEHQLTELAERHGRPLAILSDGARELHEGARCLKTRGFRGVHLDDIKHKISNLLKKKLGSAERFKGFLAKLGQTTASIQQTELEHLLPPRKKERCRFMSFGPMIDWATMVEHQLATRKSLNAKASERLTEKLGWLEDFDDDLRCWRECRHLVGRVLEYANHQGVYDGSTNALQDQLAECSAESKVAQSLREEMISFYQSNEDQLSKLAPAQIRLPCSTEVLESAFGSFKAMQGEHGRGTFTSLLAAFASLFDTCTPAKIRKRFTQVTNASLQQWLQSSGLTDSTQSRRTLAYAQAKAAQSNEKV